MTMTTCKDNICNNIKSMKNTAVQGAEFLKGLSVSNKADIDFQVKSKDNIKPMFSYKKNFNKEIKVLPIIAAVLGVILVMVLLSDCKCKSKKCSCDKE